VQNHDRAPFGVETPKRVIEDLPVGDERRGVGGRGAVDRRQLDLDDTAPAPAGDIDARMNDELTEPGIEAIGIAKRRQIPPRPDEPVLHRVARELRVPEDQPCSCIQSRDGRAGKGRKGVMIALLRSLDEVSLVHGLSPRGTTIRSCSVVMASWEPESFPEATEISRSGETRGRARAREPASPLRIADPGWSVRYFKGAK
jgi:hypothetical protein